MISWGQLEALRKQQRWVEYHVYTPGKRIKRGQNKEPVIIGELEGEYFTLEVEHGKASSNPTK